MYSTTIKSDGMLRRPPPPTPPPPPSPSPPPPSPPPPASPPSKLLPSLSSDQLLILAVALVLLQGDRPDMLLLMALIYIFFG